MWWRDLPPAGNPITLRGAEPAQLQFPGYRTVFVNSGTAALALSLLAARARNPTIPSPEVILPGYACPDLVAASVYAGVKPVLVDVGANDPGYDLAALRAGLNDRVVAVVAVNFLGIRERLPQLRECLGAHPHTLLIEDNAQWFPEPFPDAELCGDAVCLSFGRGKPVSLLGGGAMLLRDSFDIEALCGAHVTPLVSPGRLYRPKVLAYNALLEPNLYGLVSRNPWLKLGRTAYKPLLGIAAMDESRRSLLSANIAIYLQRSCAMEKNLFAATPSSMHMPASLSDRCGRLLRFPLLCRDGHQQQQLLSRLRKAGLGATAMYQRPLPLVDGVEGRVTVQSNLRGAAEFAQRLITLPLHSHISARDVQNIADIFAALS